MPGWRQEAQDRVKERTQGSTVKLAEGITCIRVLPDKKDLTPDGKVSPKRINNKPYREFRVHFSVGPDEAIMACGKDADGAGECWLCDTKIPELEASGNPQKLKIAERVAGKDQFVVNATVFDTDSNKFSMPKPWKLGTGGSTSLGIRIYSRIANSKKDLVDPVKGYNINVTRVGTGMKTKYPEIETDESPSKVPAAVLAAVKPLDSVIGTYDEEEQKSAYYGRPRRDEGEVEEGVPVDDTPEETEEPVAEEATEGEPTEEEPAEEPLEETEPESDVPEEYEAEPEPEVEEEPEPPKRKPAPAPVKKPAPAQGRPAPAQGRPAPPPPARKPVPAPARRK